MYSMKNNTPPAIISVLLCVLIATADKNIHLILSCFLTIAALHKYTDKKYHTLYHILYRLYRLYHTAVEFFFFDWSEGVEYFSVMVKLRPQVHVNVYI